MDTNQTVHASLTSGAARFEAFKAAAGTQVHELMDKLKVIYEKFHGAVGLDKLDWHWQATALKNHITANGEPDANADATAANSANTPRPGSNPDTDADPEKSSAPPVAVAPGLPHVSHPSLGAGDAPLSQGVDHSVSTIAPGTPTSLGDPISPGKPDSIKPKPDANDPTDTSFIKTTPDVTVPGQGGVTETPGSPAAEIKDPIPPKTPEEGVF